MNQRSVGTAHEETAARYLRSLGYVILENQYYHPFGEIDLIYKKGQILCFGEVKYRSSLQYGTPAQAVNAAKQQRIVRGAQIYLQRNHLNTVTVRFDVIEIVRWKDREYIRLLEDAFRVS